MDLIVRNARLHDGRALDIGIRDGHIAVLAARLNLSATHEIDAQRCLTLPAFVNAQLHACKVFWRRHLDQLPANVQALPRFDAAHHVKQRYTETDVFARVDEVMRLAVVNGTCAIRLFADVDEDNGLTALRALLRIREKYTRWMTVQVVAFPQDGLGGAHTLTLMHESMQLGADIVGGIPFIEPPERQLAHTRAMLTLARAFNTDAHFVADDTHDPASKTLELIARETIAAGWQGRVQATQCASLAYQSDDYARKVIDLVQQAGISVFCNSHVSLITSDSASQPAARNITRVRELLAAGVRVVCGQDDIDNWFYPFGRNDMLEVAQFMAHNAQFGWRGEVDRVLPMVTSEAAAALKLADYGLDVGNAANLIVLHCADWHGAIQFQPDKLHVVLRGMIVAQTMRQVFLNIS